MVLALLEIFVLVLVPGLAFNPAGLVEREGFPSAFGVVLVFQAILNHFELQLAYGADDLAPVELVDEKLCHTLVHQLGDALFELLGLHWVGILNVFEEFG